MSKEKSVTTKIIKAFRNKKNTTITFYFKLPN